MNQMMCVKGVLKGSTALSDSELQKIIDDMNARKRAAARASGGTQVSQAVSAIAAQKAERLRMEAAIQKRNAAENAIKRRVLLDARQGYRSISEWAEAQGTPSNRDLPGARNSATAKQEGYIGKYVGGFMAEMEREGLTPYVATRLRDLIDPRKWGKGPLDEKIEDELWELSIDGGKPGISGSPEAQKIAKIAHKFQELARADLNRLGAFIGKIPGYIVAQTHDMARIARAGFDAWRVKAEKAFGNDRTYENLKLTGDPAKDKATITKFWSGVYYELSTGQFFSQGEGEASGFKGPSNMAKKLSQHRSLHPNSAADWRQYNDAFGSSSLMEAVIGGLTRAGKSAGLMEKFGTNPRSQFEGMIADARKHDMDLGLPIDSRINQGGWTSRLWDVIDGTADIPASVTLAKIGAATRSYESIVKLTGAVLSSLTDMPISASKIGDVHGGNLLSRTLENFTTRLAQWTDKGQQREAALFMHVGIDGAMRDLVSRVTSADSVNWKLANKATNAAFKLNLLSWFTDSGEVGTAHIHNAATTRHQDTAHAALPEAFRKELGHYGIGAKEWDIIRQHARYDHNGVPMLLGDKLRDMPLTAIDPIADWPLDAIRQNSLDGYSRALKKAGGLLTKLDRLTDTLSGQGATGQHIADVKAAMGYVQGLLSDDRGAKQWALKMKDASPKQIFSEAQSLVREHGQALEGFRKKISDARDRLKLSKKAEPGVLEALQKTADALTEQRKILADWHAGLQRQLDRRRELAIQELESKWHTFTIGQVHGGVIRGTAREKAYATQGLQAGTPAGEAIRMMAQFKQYPMAFVQQVLGRYAQEDRFWSIPGALGRRMIQDHGVAAKVSQLVVMLTVMGYASGALKDIAKGRQPRDPRDPSTWGAAFIQGGGAGLYGDVPSARTNRFGGTALETLAGPAIGQAGEAIDLTLGFRDATVSQLGGGDKEFPDVKAFNFAKNSIPFVNQFYTRAALDYLILYRIQEALSPGSLKRMERRLKDDQGQEFILPPSEVVNQ